MARTLALLCAGLLLAACGPARHFRVVGPATINASGPGTSLNIVLEEGAYFDSHIDPLLNSHADETHAPAEDEEGAVLDVPPPTDP